jgi:hypothetical protein
MTPSTIEQAARRRLNAISSTFWSSAEVIEDCLYFALMDLCTQVKCYETTASDVSVANQQAYSWPTGTIAIRQIAFNNYKLELLPERMWFSLNLNGTTALTGTPTHYFIWGSQYFLFPTPDTGALTISVRCVSEPAAAGAFTSASTLPVPTQFHPRLVNGTAYYMLLKEVADPRIPVFEDRWLNRDIPACIDEWQRMKHADKMPRVLIEEELRTNQTGVV